jgi:hypothetical protein
MSLHHNITDFNGTLTLAEIVDAVDGSIGRHDVACPLCGPFCRAAVNQRRRVLRIWYSEPNFATFYCARCGASGYAAARILERDPVLIETAKARAAERQHLEEIDSRRKARWLWRSRQPIAWSIAETYLRDCRGYTNDLPETLGFLPARDGYPPAMIAAFGAACETLPGKISISDLAVTGVHITKLKSDGSGKAGSEADKLTIGMANRSPIWLAPVNDGLGLAVTEGIEDALSVHQATGLGAWAAGTAGRLPAMAEAVPTYVESVTVFVDADPAGEHNADELAWRLIDRGVEVRMARPELLR